MATQSHKTSEQRRASDVASGPLLGEAWGAWETTNEFDNRGKCLGYYSTEKAAKKAAAKKGWYGGNGVTGRVNTITAGGNTYLLEQREPVTIDNRDEKAEAAKAAALSKLAPHERKALGFA